MDSETPTRRRFLGSAGLATTIIIAGCSGNGDETDSPEETDPPNETDTPDETDTPEEESLFADYGIDGTELSVELTESALGQVAQIRLETPSGEKTADVSQTIPEYSLDILRDRAGTWHIDALAENEEIIETVELETTFEASVGEIGTLAQLGVTGESPELEHASYQLTVMNNGDVPIEPRQIELFVPNLYDYEDYATISSTDMEEAITDRNGETIITAGSDNTYRYRANNSASELLMGFIEEKAGQSFDGEIRIMYEAERQDTIVPVIVELGNELIEDTAHPILRGTTISKRG